VPEPYRGPVPGTADAPASKSASQPRASPPRQTKDTSRKTRGGRITKNTAQSQSVVSRGARSGLSAPTSAKVPTSNRELNRSKRAPDVLEELGDNATRAPLQPRRRQRKAYKKERASRRLAGELPEFGMLPGRGEALPHYETSLQQPLDTRKTSRSGTRRSALSTGPTVKGAKPQGVSRSRQAKTNHPKSRKGSLRAG
jgi:hypothetical protein